MICLLATSCQKKADALIPSGTPSPVIDSRISPEGVSYQDLEVDNVRQRTTYLKNKTEIWLSNLDAASGGFTTKDGIDYKLASDAAPADLNNTNGPEFGDNATGWGVYYTKKNGLFNQLWRATFDGVRSTEKALTAGNVARSSVLASTNRQLAQTRLIYIQRTEKRILWIDENTPSVENEFPSAVEGVSGPRTLPGSPDIVFCTTGGQIARYNTATKTVQPLTNDSGVKVDAFGWNAPEYGGELVVFAIVDQTSVAVYKNNGGAFWERVKTLTVDPASDHPYVYSVEPFVAQGGTLSYFSLHQQKAKLTPPLQTEASIWVWGLDGSRKRCDNGKAARRLDPEFFYGTNEVFLLYNVVVPNTSGNVWEAWRCSTGIKP